MTVTTCYVSCTHMTFAQTSSQAQIRFECSNKHAYATLVKTYIIHERYIYVPEDVKLCVYATMFFKGVLFKLQFWYIYKHNVICLCNQICMYSYFQIK